MIDVIDAHHHLWTLNAPSQHYPWLEDQPTERFHGPDAALRVDYLLDDYRADAGTLDALGFHLVGSVHIDAGAVDGLAESQWIEEVRASSGLPSVIVAGANLLSPTAAEDLERLAVIKGMRGVRHILNWDPDSRYTYTDRNNIIQDPLWLKNFARLAPLGLSFDAQVYPRQFDELACLVGANETTSFILNHAGMPIGRDSDSVHEWRHGLERLAEHPNVSIKISGLGMVDHHWNDESITPFVIGSIEAFGPERTMFASNFPVDKLYSSLVELYAALDRLTQGASHDERVALFGGTAKRIYRIPSADDQKTR